MKPIKIVNTAWHVGNQYELYKIPNTKWFQIINQIRRWYDDETGFSYRPFPSNAVQIPYYEPGKYDLAILHIDQQCIDEALGKSELYRQLNSEIKDIPKIVINHGTPYWPECYEPEFIKAKMKMLIGNSYMICNSHRAKEMWGDMGKETRVIWHGLDPEEWWDLPKEPRVVTMLSPAGLDRYYNRKLLEFIREKLKERGVPYYQITVDFKARDFDHYRKFLGKSAIYFNPTLESPMPRSRTEAMLSGCCIVTLNNHDIDRVIKHGESGFLLPDFDPYMKDKYNVKIIIDLLIELATTHYKLAVKIGQKGKEAAKKLLNKERYQKEWTDFIQYVLNN